MMPVMTREEFAGAGRPTGEGMTREEFTGVATPKGVDYYLGRAGAASAAAGDLILGAPASMLGAVIGGGRYLADRALGADENTAIRAMEEGKNLGLLEHFKTPIESAFREGARLLGETHTPYDQSGVQTLMERVTHKIADVIHARPEVVGTALEGILGALGTKAIPPMAKGITNVIARPPTTRNMPWRQAKETYNEEPVETKPTTPPDWTVDSSGNVYPPGQVAPEAARSVTTPGRVERPFPLSEEAFMRPRSQRLGPETPERAMPVGSRVRTPEMLAEERRIKETFARDPGMADYLRQLADEQMEARSHPLITEAERLGRPPEVEDWGALSNQVREAIAKPEAERTPQERAAVDTYNRHIETSRVFAGDQALKHLTSEAEATGRTTNAADFPALRAEVRDIVAKKPPFLRTAEDLIKIRDYTQRLTVAKSQIGAADPDLIRTLALASSGAIAAIPLTLGIMNYLDPEGYAKKKNFLFNRGAQGEPAIPAEEYRYDRLRNPGLKGFQKQDLLTGLAGAAALGWTKKGGGVFHPRLFEFFSDPFKNAVDVRELVKTVPDFDAMPLAMKREVAEGLLRSAHEPLQKSTSNYVKRYLGTENDPLKDINVPIGESKNARWEEITDTLLQRGPARAREKVGNLSLYPTLDEVRSGEPEWSFKRSYRNSDPRTGQEIPPADTDPNVNPTPLFNPELQRFNAEYALSDYLTKVANWANELPQNVRNKYDFVGLVKKYDAETNAKNKLLADAETHWKTLRENSVKGNNGFIVYPPVDLPERTYNYNVRKGASLHNPTSVELPAGREQFRWVQLEKPGEFFDEGAQMGHSVGGYEIPEGKPGWTLKSAPKKFNTYASPGYGLGGWEAIKSGEAQIYSLRDSQGRSYVTIEARKLPHSYTVRQIKGPNNNKIPPHTQQYVQDFLEQKNPQQAADLHKTGLTDTQFNFHHESPEAAANWLDIKNELGHGRFITHEQARKIDAEFNERSAGKNTQGNGHEAGKIDKRLAIGLGTAAAGAVAGPLIAQQLGGDPNKKWQWSLLGAGGLYGTSKILAGGKPAQTLADAAGSLSTDIGLIHPALKQHMRNFELAVKQRTQEGYDKVAGFLTELHQNDNPALRSALLSGDGAAISAAVRGNPTLQAGWQAVQKTLQGFENELKGLGRFKEGLTNYFPRIVKDYDGLMDALGKDVRKGIDEALFKADSKAVSDRGHGLTDVERSLIIDRYLAKGEPVEPGVKTPGFAKARSVQMRPELEQFYESPTDSLLRYVSGAVQDIETAKFFGKDLVTRNVRGQKFTDVGNSIEKYLASKEKAGEISAEQMGRLRELLRARFGPGERVPDSHWQTLRDVNNMTLLGDFASSVMQSGDALLSIAHHGLVPTIQAVKQVLTGDGQIHPKDLGLMNHTLEELASTTKTGKALQTIFKYSGFHALDQFGKSVHLNASLIKNQKLAATPEGRAALMEKYGQALGDDMGQLIKDLQSGKRTDLTNQLNFSELSDAQPISKSEMPKLYLEHPNGRLLWQMKSYALKQLDVIRRESYQEMKKGNYAKAIKNLALFGTVMATSNIPANAVKAWISGQDFDFSKIDYLDNFLQNVGLSKYTADKLFTGGPMEALGRVVSPAMSQYDAASRDPNKAMRMLPFVGREAYNLVGGGNEAKARQDRIKAKQDAETPEERAMRFERRAERKRRQLEREQAR